MKAYEKKLRKKKAYKRLNRLTEEQLRILLLHGELVIYMTEKKLGLLEKVD